MDKARQLQRSQCALTRVWKLREVTSTTFESFEFSPSSSSVSHRTANKIGENDVTFVTGFGSVYHSRRDCGKLRAAKTVGKFLPCRECNPEAPPKFYENKVPLPVKRK